MNILITGGCGFIGSSFIDLLTKKTRHQIINLDLLTYAGHKVNCQHHEENPRYKFVRGDVADRKIVSSVLSDFSVDVIVNFAAESHVDRSIYDAHGFIHTNVMGTQTLLDIAREQKIKRFLQVSTDEVYGYLNEGEEAFTEDFHLKPSSPYAASKAAADMLVLASFRTHRQPVLITRCSNNYGIRQFPEKFIPLATHRVLMNDTIPVYGKGVNIRDWIHVEDHCRGVLSVLENGREGEVYNFGGSCEMRNIDVVKRILEITGKSEILIQYVADRPGHDFRYAMNFDKAAKEFGWQPEIKFMDGLKETIEWYRANISWTKMVMGSEFSKFFSKHYGDVK